MAGLLGNIFALIIIVVAGLFGFSSLELSTLIFISLSYGLWLLAAVFSFISKPSKDADICLTMTPMEVEAYRRYSLYLLSSLSAQMLSAMMNLLRIAGFVWGVMSLWNELYWLGGISLAYFFVSGGLIARLDPDLYLGRPAQAGHEVANEQLFLIKRVLDKKIAFTEENRDD